MFCPICGPRSLCNFTFLKPSQSTHCSGYEDSFSTLRSVKDLVSPRRQSMRASNALNEKVLLRAISPRSIRRL